MTMVFFILFREYANYVILDGQQFATKEDQQCAEL